MDLTFRLSRPDSPLPSAPDFFAGPHPAEAAFAWENFGGLSLADAFSKFVNCPEVYYEDFMWMFQTAFAYFFPVVDKYLRE